MRPLRLELEGLTSFRDKVSLDFDGLDLFAITGATGAGKSSLIDALTFALYGQVPRVGREYRQLISHGAERLSVLLEFGIGDARYRIARTVRASGQPHVRLERITGGVAEPVADRVKDIETEVERIVGLDYEAFIRSVVLPQGQFDAFLKGKPEERRKILVALLNLRVYEDMHAEVNRRAADAKREAEFIGNQLAAEYAGATPEAVAAGRRELADCENEIALVTGQQETLTAGLEAASAVRRARREQAQADADLRAEAEHVAEAEGVLGSAAKRRQELAARLAALDARTSRDGFDAERHVVLAGARPMADQLAGIASQLVRLETDLVTSTDAVAQAQLAVAQAETGSATLESEAQQKRAQVETARAAREDVRRRHAAHALRQHLTPGQPCPVCEQVVARPPSGTAPELAAADRDLTRAESAARESEQKAQQSRIALEARRGDAKARAAALESLTQQREEVRARARSLRESLAAAGFTPIELADPETVRSFIQKELTGLEKAKVERERVERERKSVEAARATLEAEAAAANGRAEASRRRVAELTQRREQAAGALERAAACLAELARSAGWDVAPSAAGRDERDVLESRQAELQRTATRLAGSVARLRSETLALENAVARGLTLGERKKALEAEAALAGMLAQHLQANQFVAYVQEEALRVLADDGGTRLRSLSQGRYSLECEAQEFCVVDHWNADMKRSVKTLSGGETFLASLALALALAESLAALSSAGRAGDALESLFLDEGFGTLDPETLGLVVQAIEALQGGQRMVGVVTHMQELAEQLPARLVVGRTGDSASLSVV